MNEMLQREVKCLCGEQVFTSPSLTVRCPQCGRKLFWKCQCGTLVERTKSKCPHCGADHEKTRPTVRPPIRLRKIISAGLLGAIILTLLGYWSHKALSRLLIERAIDPTESLPSQSGNIIALTLKGISLLVSDMIKAVGRIVHENPMFLVLPILGFLIAAGIVAKNQQLSWKRLKRHLRRKWEQFASRWSKG